MASGIRIMAMGIILLALGALGIMFYLSGTVTNPLVMGAGSVFLIFGLLLLFLGMFGATYAEYAPKQGVSSGDTAIFSHTLIRCMIAITVSDNVLEDSEVKAVRSLYKRVTGSEISEAIVRETAGEMLEKGVDIIKELKNTQANLDKGSKEKIIIASLYILAADGVMDEGEELFLEDIRDGLRVPMGRFDKIKRDFLASRALKARAKG